MADTTPSHDLPYPEGADDAVPHADIQDLAEKLDTELDDIAPSQITGVAAGRLLIANASGVVTATAVTGDITIGSDGVAEIGAGKVATPEIAANAVTTAKIDGGAVTGPKMAAKAVKFAQLSLEAKGSTGSPNATQSLPAGFYLAIGLSTGGTPTFSGGTILSQQHLSWNGDDSAPTLRRISIALISSAGAFTLTYGGGGGTNSLTTFGVAA